MQPEPMQPEQLEYFRHSLIFLKDEIEQIGNTGRKAAGTVTFDPSMMGHLSRMDALQGQQMAQDTARRRKIQLQKIDSALRRCHRRHRATRDLLTSLTSKVSRG